MRPGKFTRVTLQFNELMDPTSLYLNPGAVTLTETSPAGPVVTGTFSFSDNSACLTRPDSSASCNFSILQFTYFGSVWRPNATYTLNVPDGLLADLSGNFDPFTSTFTTSPSSTPVTTNGTITSITPTSGATNVALQAAGIIVQLSRAVDPLTVNPAACTFSDDSVSGNPVVPGNVAISANFQTVMFTQTLPFEPDIL